MTFKILGLAATAAVLAAASMPATAAIATTQVQFNAAAHCQAFTPGPANTIRNRVVGSENVGTAAIAVACSIPVRTATSSSNPTEVSVYFSNNNASGTISVACTLLTGFQTGANTIANKTTSVSPGIQGHLTFLPSDITPSATEFASPLIGVNCSLPPGGVINDIYMYSKEENGVGS